MQKGGKKLNKTGLILKLQDNTAFVISKDCMYFQIKRKPGMFKGQTVEFNKSDIVYNRSFFATHYKLIAAAAAVLVIMMSIIFYINAGLITKNSNIYAFIDIDINPSLELTIDKYRHIQDLYPLNRDAELLASELDLKDASLENGLSKIIDKSKELGFLNAKEKDVVLISAALNGKKEGTSALIMGIRSDVNQLKDKNIKAQVIDVPQKTRELAIENNISMGRYVLYEKARKSGLNLSIEAAKALSLEKMMEQVNLIETQVNNSITPSKTPQPAFQVAPQGNGKKSDSMKTNTPSYGKRNEPASVFIPTPAQIQGNVPIDIPERFTTLAPAATPSKAVQADPDRNNDDDLIPVSTPAPTLTPTATVTLLPTATPLSQGSISMSFDTKEIHSIGQVICATLEAKNIRKLSGFQANLKYDPQILQPVDSRGKAYTNTTRPENGTLLQNSNYMPVAFSFNDISNGILNFGKSYSYTSSYKKDGLEEYTGSLAIIRFKVLQLKDTNIIFQNTNSLKGKSGIVLLDWDGVAISNFVVLQPDSLLANSENAPSVSFTLTPTPTDTDLQTQKPIATPITTPTATPITTPMATPTATPATRNFDINSDGYINMEDCLLIDKAFNTCAGESGYNPACDLNSDTIVNLADKMAFFGYLSKQTTPVPTTHVTPYPASTPVSTPLSENYISMSFDTTEINTVGQVLCATLEVNNIRNLAGFQANIQYDPQVLQPVNAAGNAYTKATNPENGTLLQNSNYMPMSVSFNDISTGRLNFSRSYSYIRSYKNNGPEEHTGSLATIRFKVLQLKDTNIIFRNTNNSLNEKYGIVLSDWDGEVNSNFEVVQPVPLVVNPVNNPTITPTPTDTGVQTLTPTATPTATPMTTPIAAPVIGILDINSDGVIDSDDVTALINAFNTSSTDPNFNPAADLNNDGVINSFDTSLFGISFSENQGTGIIPLPTTPVIKSFDINQDGSIDIKDMEALDKALNTMESMSNFNPAADLNSNSTVSTGDRMLLMIYFNEHNIPIPAMPTIKSLDINGDGSIGQADMEILLSLNNVKSTDPDFNPAADLNSDNVIDDLDKAILMIYHIEHPDAFIHPSPTPTPTSTPTPTPTQISTPTAPVINYDINGDGYIDIEDLALIDQAFNSTVGDPNYNPACDLNGDDHINMVDKMAFYAYLSKQTTPVPAYP